MLTDFKSDAECKELRLRWLRLLSKPGECSSVLRGIGTILLNRSHRPRSEFSAQG